MKKMFIGLLATCSLTAFAATQEEINQKFSERISQYEFENNTICVLLGQEEVTTGGLAKHTIRNSYGCKNDLNSNVVLVQETLKNNRIHPFKRGPISEYELTLTEHQTLRKH